MRKNLFLHIRTAATDAEGVNFYAKGEVSPSQMTRFYINRVFFFQKLEKVAKTTENILEKVAK